MGVSRISFRKPLVTRGGNKIRLYHIYQDEIHGAYEAADDQWIICRWELDGHFYPRQDGGQVTTLLDLVNEWEEDLKAAS